MSANRTSSEYRNGVNNFLEWARKNAIDNNGKFRCPCMNCLNMYRLRPEVIKDHLIIKGIDQTYTNWTNHGEQYIATVPLPERVEVEFDMSDHLEEMLNEMGPSVIEEAVEGFESLVSDAGKFLYPGSKHTRLSAVLKLFTLKAKHGWTNISFTKLLELLVELLPEGNTLPVKHYDAKKVLCPIGMEVKRIHVCPNDCVLFRKELANLDKCPTCGASRYKAKAGDHEEGFDDENIRTKRTAVKQLFYLPLSSRLKRLYASPHDAKQLRWHADERIRDGKIRHPADALQWKDFDEKYGWFGNEPRNLRLGLATDGMNPYGNLSTNHSSWPVLLVIYNLPPWLCMKRKYMMLSMMISGPKQPGNDIDVCLTPLIEELEKLWVEGIEVFDAVSRDHFKMHAMLLCTINDFPAYGNLSGYSVKGHYACPICEERTCYHQLKYGRKTVYLHHRRFLKQGHPYRRLKKAFNGHPENADAPTPLTGDEVYQRVKDIEFVYGKTQKRSTERRLYKRCSIFIQKLPYFKGHPIRNCLDVMHVEKNVTESLVGTLLNIPGKTKDSLNARLDMKEMGIREKLHPQPYLVGTSKKAILPPACHTLSREEKRRFCECLNGIKVPHGYSSNIKSLVSMKDLKLVGMKSHDCHILMQHLLPVAIRGILPKKVRDTITRLCLFFNAICSKVIDPNGLTALEEEGHIILLQLEMYFPPAFFDIMVHLVIHLVREIKYCGPVHLRWMYPVERYMKILKGYMKNPRHPEGSIIERYVAEECIEFCTSYLAGQNPIGIPINRHEGRSLGKGTRGERVKSKNPIEVSQAHFYILNNTDAVAPFISEHIETLRRANPRLLEKSLLILHKNTFAGWFKRRIINDNTVSQTIKWLAAGPNTDVVCWSAYDINNYCFHTKSQDAVSTMQNSGVMLEADTVHISRSGNQSSDVISVSYYGIIDEIWEMMYTTFRVAIFKCLWVDSRRGVKTDDFGIKLVNFNKLGHKDDPFVMASQVQQCFYIKDPSLGYREDPWSVVLQGKRMPNRSDDNQEPTMDIPETPSISTRVPTFLEEVDEDVEHATRDDHNEGLLVDNITL